MRSKERVDEDFYGFVDSLARRVRWVSVCNLGEKKVVIGVFDGKSADILAIEIRKGLARRVELIGD